MKPVVLSLSSSVFLSFFMGCLEENFTWNGASSHKRQTLSLTLTHIHTLVPRHQLCEKHPVCDCGRILCDKHKKEVGPSMTHTHFLFFFFFMRTTPAAEASRIRPNMPSLRWRFDNDNNTWHHDAAGELRCHVSGGGWGDVSCLWMKAGAERNAVVSTMQGI